MTADLKDVNGGNNSTEAIKYRPSTSEENGDAILFKDDSKLGLRPLMCKTWWRRRTAIEKSLALLFGGTAFLCIILIIILAAQQGSKQSQTTNENVCTTSGCVQTASELLKKMDLSVDPCVDFYQYACGKWERGHYIPEDQSVYDIFTEMRDKVDLIGKRLLEEESPPSEPEFITKAKTFYRSCLDESQIEKHGKEPILAFIADLEGWPVMGTGWDRNTWNLVKVLGKLRTVYDTRTVIDMWIAADDKNSDKHIIFVDQPSLGMPSRDYFLKNTTETYMNAYLDYMVNIAMLLRTDDDEEDVRRQMEDALAFETKMAEYSVPKADRRDMDKLYNKMTIRELQDQVPQFDWMTFMQMSTPDTNIDENEYIVNYSPSFISNLGELIATTPKRTIANYVIWNMIQKNVAYLSGEFRTIRQEFQKISFGQKAQRVRWRQCVRETTGSLGMAVGALFVEDNFNEESRETALEMISDIRESFRTMLREIDWMDARTKVVAEEKADAIIERIGYPDYILDPEIMNEEYKSVHVNPTNFFQNVLAIYKWSAYESLSQLRKTVDKEKWKTTPATVNAFYNPSRNEIAFPAGILQPPFYSQDHPKSMNYGGIGMVIGHEITHGFDDRGRQYDKNGNTHQWWSEESVENFKKKAQCIVDQYSNYTVPEINMNINGVQTQGENIADNGGMKEAFMAYRRWVERNGKEEDPLPGINLTHNQLFFVNFGQVLCIKYRPEALNFFVSSRSHTVSPYRVFGPVSNSPDFAKAFSCKRNTPMNPEKKCDVW